MPTTNTYMNAVYPCGPADGNITITGSTTTTNGTDQLNMQFKGIQVSINITILTAGTLTVTIQGKDAVSGQYFTVLASAAIAATGFSTLTVYPGIAVSANVTANTILPGTFRLVAAVATGPCTATISSVLIP